MAPAMSVPSTGSSLVLLTTVLFFAILTMSSASSLPPENQQMNVHLGSVQHKSSFSPHPIEDVDNSLMSGGREVEPRPPDTAAIASSSPSSVKKELGTEVPALAEGKVDILHKDQPNQALYHKDLTTSVPVDDAEVKPFNDYGQVEEKFHSAVSSIVPRKGVGDMPSSVVARKGAEYNSSDSSLDTELVMTTSNSEDLVPATSTPLPLNTLYSTSTASGFVAAAAAAPVNDIPVPPMKQVTPARSATSAPPPPSPSLAYAPSSLSYAPPPTATIPPTKHASKRLKPAVAVDAVNNKALDNTPVIMGVTFGVVIILVLAIVAYKKLQDVWSRRHYDRMDFLIDGMYDL